MPYEHDREFYRLVYPLPAAPRLIIDGVAHRVVDIGEGGFRYALSEPPGPMRGDDVKGTIEFAEEDPLEVEGVVVRLGLDEVAVHCKTRPIPLGVVLREQRRLRRRFPYGT